MTSRVPIVTLRISLACNVGTFGVDATGDDPMSRAWRVLLQEGRPVTATSMCLFADSDELLNPRWLGMLALSAGDRIIFFPGLGFRPEWIQSGNRAALELRPFIPDHLTLERNRRNWHFTTSGSTAHQRAGTARSLEEGFVSWFGMTVATPDALRELKRETRVTADIPASDIERRFSDLRALTERQPQHMVTLDPRTQRPFASIHFAFLIGPPNAPEYSGAALHLPFGSPFAETPLPEIRNLPVRCHRVPLGDVYAVHIVATALPMRLSVPVAFTTGIPGA